jgi:predicted homoserine dehydrogenase-like protein
LGLYALLQQREETKKLLKIGVIGAGTFSSAFLSQARLTPGMQLVGVAELDLKKAKDACIKAGWPEETIVTGGSSSAINDAAAAGKVTLTDNADQLLQADLDVMIEATGVTEAGTHHAWTALDSGKHVVMVNVETDALLGLALKRKASEKGILYSMAYGDQPAIICELIDWARTVGAEVVCAGKGTRYQPEYHYSTPETVWKHFGFTEEQRAARNYNPQMYNSFLDGTKSAIEMCAVANASGLVPQRDGLQFTPVGADRLPDVLIPKAAGGILEHSGTVEIVASENRDGTSVKNHLRWGLYVVFKALTDYMLEYMSSHESQTDASGQYSVVYRQFHLIGLELGVSVASVALRGEATGSPASFVADVASVAKKDLKPGDVLDGEGGYTVFGRLVRADESVSHKYLPVGLGRGVKVVRPVAKGSFVTYDDLEMDASQFSFKLRRQLEEELRSAIRK